MRWGLLAVGLALLAGACSGESEGSRDEIFFDLDSAVELAEAALIDVDDLRSMVGR